MDKFLSHTAPQHSSSRMMPVELQDEVAPKIKAYYKYELAEMYSVCTKTFSAWIHMYFEELQQFGYTKHTKLLRPEIVRFLFERLGEP
ncbi:DUF4248 domain-containing protein [Marivirga atlantica]|uniref:DUF4248 domain-containing protein n=1 Tax=Marivirga atlantica TaxID=1548457 RepID=A0A937ADM5_9BACT|nr:DUF4248 domain-containing protein [Marivirga atlantica]MBL0767096.1 DUF4248 domain-containing protein [Marivirga atlantica]